MLKVDIEALFLSIFRIRTIFPPNISSISRFPKQETESVEALSPRAG